MYLTLEVVSANAASAGTRRKVFSVEGGRIGRSPENDMVLAAAGVHRHHATVRFINGVFFIEGVGTNGIAINNPDVVLPRNEPYPLKTGDKVYLDEFELAVTTSATPPAEPAAPRAPVRDFAPGGLPEIPGAGAHSPAPFLGAASPEELDPLRQLGRSGSSTSPGFVSPPTPPVDSAWNHTPSLSDHFTPPPPSAPASPVQAIPEDWDKTSFNRSKLMPPAPTPAPQRPVPPLGGPVPSPLGSPPVPPASMTPSWPAPPSPNVGARPLPASPAVTPAPARGPSPAFVPPEFGASASVPGVAAAAGADAPFDWNAFLRSAGVDPATVPADCAEVLGHIMRTVVQGLIEVLRARSEIKTEFRMPVTQVKVSENNPLKFAANAEDALSTLFGRRNPAYLAPKEAFEDAFNDVRFHQLAMLVGVRAGFESLMSRFDPEQLQELFERQGKRGGLFGGGGRARYWEMYVDRFKELAADRDDTFRRLFGEEFARAYEQQLAVLKRGRAPR